MRRPSIFLPAILLAIVPLAAANADNFDGGWRVTIVTQKGTCDKAYSYPLRVTDGVISYAGGTSATMTGKVEDDGNVRVKIELGGQSASGVGRLSAKSGSGTWVAGSNECSGKWSALRGKAETVGAADPR